MINVCLKCGLYRNDKTVDLEKKIILCPECGHESKYKFLPLFIIFGASGAGKTTICNYLVGQPNDFIVLDMDILWSDRFANPKSINDNFNETWLRVAKNISQSGMPVALFGAGCMPDYINDCIESRYFSKINYTGLVCSDSVLINRLKNRPGWRKSSSGEFIHKQVEYYNHIKLLQGINIIKTDTMDTKEAATKIKCWINSHIMPTY